MVDLNEEVKEEAPVIDPIEEVKQEAPEPVVDTTNEIIEETAEPPKEEVKEEVRKPVRAQDKIITCPKCNKSMKTKSYRYGHEQNCKGTLEQKPVKPHAKPRAKQQPKPKPLPQPIYEEEEEQQPEQVKFKLAKPPPQKQAPNPLLDIRSHYQLLQQQYMKQKQEKYNSLCSNMFSTKTKKR